MDCSSWSTFFLGVDDVDDRVTLHFELGSAHVVAGLEQGDGVLRLLDGEVGLGHPDLLVDGLHREAVLLERRLALGVVVFDDQILFAGQGAHGRERGDLHGAVQVGSVERNRADGAQLAAGEGADDDVAALHPGHRDGVLPFRKLLIEAVAVPAARHQNRQPDQTIDRFFHGFRYLFFTTKTQRPRELLSSLSVSDRPLRQAR